MNSFFFRLGSLTVVALLAGGCARSCAAGPGVSDGDCLLVSEGAGPAGTTAVRAEPVVSGLEVPWGLAFLPGGELLVTERPGRVRLVKDGVLQPTPVATVSIAAGGEGGLLGLALHPGFAQNRAFFLYVTVDGASGRENQVQRWILADDLKSATFEKVVFGGIGAAQFHDGGRLRIGPDGMLYVSAGDAREPSRSQDRANLNGKLLRLTPEGEVPADNPFAGSPVFLWGLRNSQGFDWFDDGVLVVTDHGPSGELGRFGHDEVSVARAGDNLGWPTVYGCGRAEGLVTPVLTWSTAAPPGGAALYRGNDFPAWKGSLLVGVLGGRHLHRVAFDAQHRRTAHEVYLEGEPPAGLGRIREVLSGPDGQLYLTTSNCDGRGDCPPDKDRVVRLVPQ